VAPALAPPYDTLVPWLHAHPGLSDADTMAALQSPTVGLPGPIPKTAFAPLLATAIGRVYDPSFPAPKLPYWLAILQLWTSLDEVHPQDPRTQAVITRAVLDGVLLLEEVDAQVTAATRRVSQLEAWGVDVSPGHVASARQLIAQGA
jgi:hypothetical protein